MKDRYAVLIDGGFLRKKLGQRNGHFPTVPEIVAETERIKQHPALTDYSLLRIYYYDAPPAAGVITNPVDGSKTDLAATKVASDNLALQQSLEMLPDFALRSGESAVHGWALGTEAIRDLAKNGARALTAKDFLPNIEQKGVDLRIGLDIARLSLKQLVQVIVVMTGDSDMIPAFKFARREGMRVFLDHLGHGVKRDLKAHTDLVL
ncbi:MAG TPA: NYN domain-containing protein [Devosia sp.]|nr:NYN domain-containing protein [Devosia sp.]